MYDYKTYIFKDKLFWEFDDYNARSAPGSPHKIKDSKTWNGVPDDIDEILLWGGNWGIYFFKGSKYYRYDGVNKVIDPGYPRDISAGWQGIPNDIDAAFTISSDVTYFLKGDLVYKFDNFYDKLYGGFPQKISDHFPGVPNNVDAAFRWYYDGEVYFFKGEYYYRWDAAAGRAEGPYVTQLEWKNLCNV